MSDIVAPQARQLPRPRRVSHRRKIMAGRASFCYSQGPLSKVRNMRTTTGNVGHTYQLVLRKDGRGDARTIEFQASGRESALHMAQRQCRDREAELIEDGRSLGRIQCVGSGGYWRLLPTKTGPSPS